MNAQNVYGDFPKIRVGNLDFEVESYFTADSFLYVHLCNPEMECDAKVESLSDENIGIITKLISDLS